MSGMQPWQLFLVAWSGLAVSLSIMVASEVKPAGSQKKLLPASESSLSDDVQHAAMRYRITVYNTFRLNRREYNRRLAAWNQVFEAWLAGGGVSQQKPLVLDWLREATLRSQPGRIGSLPRLPNFHTASIESSDSTEHTAEPPLLSTKPMDENSSGFPTPPEPRPQPVTPPGEVPPLTKVPREPKQQLLPEGPEVELPRLPIAAAPAKRERQRTDVPVAASEVLSASPARQKVQEEVERQRLWERLQVLVERQRTPAAAQPIKVPVAPRAKAVTAEPVKSQTPAIEPRLEERLVPDSAKSAPASPQPIEVRRPVMDPLEKHSRTSSPRPVGRASLEPEVPKLAPQQDVSQAARSEAVVPAGGKDAARRVRVNEVEMAARVAGYNRNLRALENRLLMQPALDVRELALAVAELKHLEELHDDGQLYLPLLEPWQRPHVGEFLPLEEAKRLVQQRMKALRSKLASATAAEGGGQQRWQLDVLDALKRQLEE